MYLWKKWKCKVLIVIVIQLKIMIIIYGNDFQEYTRIAFSDLFAMWTIFCVQNKKPAWISYSFTKSFKWNRINIKCLLSVI